MVEAKKFGEIGWAALQDLKRGDTTSMIALLRSDEAISARVRTALANFLEAPPKRGRGRPEKQLSADEMHMLNALIRFLEDPEHSAIEKRELKEAAASLLNLSIDGLQSRMKKHRGE